ncbi:MAG: SUMF1/EgtB/PvdO family nonheme iron enzyme [Chloroflexota bacterium]|nr:SUMF1/EgtB/PvdO family nonheme iron enzyme [Chloroflexota bacterium]
MADRLRGFISYKREDQPFAERLWQLLGEWGHEPWLDVKNLDSGITRDSSTWIDGVHNGLKQSAVVIGVLTPESLKSQNVRDEWYWARNTSRRILFLRLRPFDPEDVPPPFAETDYIDLVTDERAGFERLQRELEKAAGDRRAAERDITPPPIPHDDKPKAIPPYLLQQPARNRRAPWRLTLRFLGIIGVPIAFLWLLFEPGFEPLLAFLGAIASLLASWIGSSEDGDLSNGGKLTDVEQMRRRVYQYWVQGVMETALKEVETVGIALDMQPEAVVRDTRRNIGDIALPNDSRHVRQVYDTFRSFLILGDPGAGKTIMLLQLAQSLILAPPPTHAHAIPLVLNLSSWALNRKPLAEWLEDETWRTYRVRGNRVGRWLANNQLILLLDGLDEVKEDGGARVACVETINAFREAHPTVPMVVCSRIKDYEKLGETKLALTGAILLEELRQEQVDHYLSHPGLAHIKRVVAEDPILRQMSTTPFLLNTMIYAYRHEPEDGLRGFTSEAARREHLFTTYVQRRFVDNPPPHGYEQTDRYLRWLATKMQAYVQTVFRPNDISPDWMADDQGYERALQTVRWLVAAVLVVLYAAVGWQMSEWIGMIAWGLLGLAVGMSIHSNDSFRMLSLKQMRNKFGNAGQNAVIYAIVTGFGSVLLVHILNAHLAEGDAFWVVYGVIGILMSAVVLRHEVEDWKSFGMIVLSGMWLGHWFGGLTWDTSNIIDLSVWVRAVIASLIAPYLIGHMLIFEVLRKSVPTPSAAHRAPLALLLSGAAFGTLGVVLNIGPLLGVATAMTYAVLFNGLTLLQTPFLKLRIRQNDVLPLRIERFLEQMAERQILRRMGGGYIFIHRYLLENYAGLDEVDVLIEQLSSQEDTLREKAIAALRNMGEPAVHLIHNLSTDFMVKIPPNRRNNLFIGIDSIQMRPGVGLRADGLPDIAWCAPIANDAIWIYQYARHAPLPPYQISKYLVTNAQFQMFIDDVQDGYNQREWWTDDGWAWKGERNAPDEYDDPAFRPPNHPRIYVRWYEAVAFCNWLTWHTAPEIWQPIRQTWQTLALETINGLIRLPTEQEWERAARGTDGREYPYPGKFDRQKGNVRGTGIKATSAVGIFPDSASPCGALDMSGNVCEWCLTQYESGSQSVYGTDVRVVRGGSWDNESQWSRTAYRSSRDIDGRLDSVGFRLARSS